MNQHRNDAGMSDRSKMAAGRGSMLLLAALVAGCAAAPQQPQTLADIDAPLAPTGVMASVSQADSRDSMVPTATVSTETPEKVPASASQADLPSATPSRQAARQAWYEYIHNASPDDIQHAQAVRRLAELELSAETSAEGVQHPDSPEAFEERVRSVIDLLKETLARFPDARGNDETLYQLAKAHDQLGQGDTAVDVLKQLVSRYPRSAHIAEAQFRIAESAFAYSDYAAAEDAYTEVLKSRDRAAFQEKALFKRGWSRFKRQDYLLALEDYMAAASIAPPEVEQSPSQKALYEEHLRAIGLTFIQLGGVSALREYYAPGSNNAGAGRQLEYPVYLTVSDLLAEQQRPSDAVAVLEEYASRNPASPHAVHFALRTVDIWKDAGFFNQYRDAFDKVYSAYKPGAPYWAQMEMNADEKAALLATMRKYTLQLGSHFHTQFRKSKNPEAFAQAERWYARFLESFSAHARQEKIYPLLAELHRQNGQPEQALRYHELAAFDGELVLSKDSAYACLQLTDQLHQAGDAARREQWLQKHLAYAQRFAQLYPADPVSSEVVRHAVQLASRHRQLEQLIALATLLPDETAPDARHEVSLLKGQALFDLERYGEAEVVYQDLLADSGLDRQRQTTASHRWALSVYRQGEIARSQERLAKAHQHFLQIYQQMPESSLAPRAVYDAVALLMQERQWAQAITWLETFRKNYPRHDLIRDADKLLSEAYLEADRPMDAAMNLEQFAEVAEDPEEKRAALWRAAELYSSKSDGSKSDSTAALRAWQNYVERYPRPFDSGMEAMAKVTEIFGEIRNESQKTVWLRKILAADAEAAASARTERTQRIAARAAFELAEASLKNFDQIRLVHPLSQSLQRKKVAMQESTKLLSLASQYGHADMITRATFEIGDMYRRFATSLLESEPPAELSAEELEQYRFLLEDQAWPFEDKAIEFYEINVARIREGLFDQWVKQSLEQLSTLYPARYARHGKLETSIEQL